MIDVKWLESKDVDEKTGLLPLELYKKNLINRSFDTQILDNILETNSKRKALTKERDEKKSLQNKVGKDIAIKKKSKEDCSELLEQMQEIAQHSKKLNEDLNQLEENLKNFSLQIPNLCAPDVVIGDDESQNLMVRTFGEKPNFDFKPLEHWEIGEKNDGIDFERAAKITGSRFALLKKNYAKLERILIQFMIDTHVEEHGYDEVLPPYLVNTNSLIGTGQLPKFESDLFKLKDTGYYLIPTAEVPITNIYNGETLKEDELPIHLTAYTPCFRSEAGSHGRDTKGLIRQHQFNKVELVKFCHPDESEAEHEALTKNAETILQKLELPYELVSLCTGDISFGARKCYDINVWLPGQNTFREISSCSNFGDFQARRANIRFKPKGEKTKPQFIHTLNGSGLAVGRTLVAILENYQQADGRVRVPTALKKYFNTDTI